MLTVLLRGQQSQVDFGPSRLRPDATIALDGDVGHGWLIGEVNPTTALSDGSMRTRGPNATILNTLALVKVLTPKYKEILAEAGEELPESLDASLLPEIPKAEKPAEAPGCRGARWLTTRRLRRRRGAAEAEAPDRGPTSRG